MHAPTELVRIIDRKRYSVATATLLAGDDYWDGHNHERRGRNTFLYRTPKGCFFTVTLSQWQGEESPSLRVVSLEEALSFYESTRKHSVAYGDAFPTVTIDDA